MLLHEESDQRHGLSERAPLRSIFWRVPTEIIVHELDKRALLQPQFQKREVTATPERLRDAVDTMRSAAVQPPLFRALHCATSDAAYCKKHEYPLRICASRTAGIPCFLGLAGSTPVDDRLLLAVLGSKTTSCAAQFRVRAMCHHP